MTINSNDIIKQYNEHCKFSGSTFQGGKNLVGKPLFVVGIGLEKVIKRDFNILSELNAYAIKHKQVLNQSNTALGTWFDASTGTTYLDVVRVCQDELQAYLIGVEHNELAYCNLETGNFINI